MKVMMALLMLPLLSCGQERASYQAGCDGVPGSFLIHVDDVLNDSTDLFQGAYPPATPLTCELLVMLEEELKDDSARYCFDLLAREHWMTDPHARVTHAYIERHHNFPLAMAATAHWNEDHRIRGLRELQEYRRIRPMVCATKEHYARLETQDHAAVRYLITVLETTPMFISGSENATIHQTYLRTVMETLDLFTGQQHMIGQDRLVGIHRSEEAIQQALIDWHGWLDE
ncbi:MAG: hypothetical protein R2811_13095 [Flavobacteriales bacterium]